MKLLKYYNSRVCVFGSRGRYFEYMILTYGRRLSQFGLNPVANKWKKAYQDEGLDLQKKNFKPEPDFWEEFRHIGLAYGLGMCKLFVVLLELEHKRWLEAGSPDDFYEKPRQQDSFKTFGVNSSKNLSFQDKKTLISLLSSNKYTVLIRSMDFTKKKLHRICMIT